MKRVFCNWLLSVMLMGTLGANALAESGTPEQPEKKEKVQIIVAEKKDREKPANNNRPQNRQRDKRNQ